MPLIRPVHQDVAGMEIDVDEVVPGQDVGI
jgi:hypothetical protein